MYIYYIYDLIYMEIYIVYIFYILHFIYFYIYLTFHERKGLHFALTAKVPIRLKGTFSIFDNYFWQLKAL